MLYYGDTKVVLGASRGPLDLFEEGSKSNSEAGPGERHVDALNPPLLPKKEQVALCSRL